MKKLFSSCLFLMILFSCARAPLKDPQKSFLPASVNPEFRDSYDTASLKDAIQKTLAAFKTSKIIPQEFYFADRVIGREEYRASLEALLPELENFDRFHSFVRSNFDVYEVYGDEKPGEVFSTGYYEVKMKGSLKPKGAWSEPIYRAPGDLVTVDLKAYGERLPEVKPLQDLILEQKAKSPSWKGRLVKEGVIPKVVPYYQRSDLQRTRPLAGKGLEIAYVNPIDAFILEIEGSGVVELENGKSIRVGYEASNGSKYEAIGKHLYHLIPKEQMTMQRIRKHLETLNRDQLQDIFDKNPSYVFFKPIDSQALTYSGAEVTAMRTIASDQFLFPKGVLCFLDIELPIFSDAQAIDPATWESKPRWVLDQDTGGAIRGGGRIDLFMGSGEEPARLAGVMKRKGHLWAVAPKAEFLQRLKANIRTQTAAK